MKPRTISASSLNTADSCLARYKAENIEFTPTGADKSAANVGTACHGALEHYVERVYMKKEEEPKWSLLESIYNEQFLIAFDIADKSMRKDEFEDGLQMLQRWFLRNDFEGVEVLSVERKMRFPIPTSAGDIPLTYICDRVDLIEVNGKKILRVVDYKSIRAFLSHEEVREKLQARIYDLMMRVQYKDLDIDEFHVVFDLLRHEEVGVVYTREEAEDTWRSIILRAERILATPDENPPETLNPDCPYCVRKSQCKTLQKNIAGGGILSIQTIGSAAELREQLANQKKGIDSALKELDEFIMAYAKNNDVSAFNTENGFRVAISGRKTRVVDAAMAAGILGPELMGRFGKLNITDVDNIIKNELIEPDKIAELNQAIGTRTSSTSVKVTKKGKK